MITISVNNQSYEFETAPTLSSAIAHTKISTDGIAIAVNQEIISQSDWEAHQLSDNDQVLIIKATQGG